MGGSGRWTWGAAKNTAAAVEDVGADDEGTCRDVFGVGPDKGAVVWVRTCMQTRDSDWHECIGGECSRAALSRGRKLRFEAGRQPGEALSVLRMTALS